VTQQTIIESEGELPTNVKPPRHIEVAHPAQAEVTAGPLAMAMQAMKHGMSIADMRDMLALQKEWEANEARKAYNEAMSAFKAEAIEIIKRKEVDFTNKSGVRTNYKHAELSDVVQAVGPALSRHGFSWSWTPTQDKGWITVTCTLKHRQGHSESVQLSAPADDSGGKNTIQQIASTVTYLSRHTLKAICGVSEKGDDNDGAAAPTLLEGLLGKVALAADADQLKAISKDGVAALNKARDKESYPLFVAAVQKRGAELKEATA
jgi:hypothetical protein